MKEKVIAFPQLGDYAEPLKRFMHEITGLKVLNMPPITKKTIAIGSKYSPDSVCVPFKYILGNFIESIEQGANVLFHAGGGCRYRYYAEVQETILKDLGYDFEMIQVYQEDGLKPQEAFQNLKKLNPELTVKQVIKKGIYTFFYITYLDKLDYLIRSRIGFEVVENSFLSLKENFIKEANTTPTLHQLKKIYHKYKKQIKKLKIKKPKHCLKVGIIGELYTSMEPFSNYDLEKLLAKNHIEIKRFTNLSYLLWQKKLLLPYMKWKVRKYCRYTLGADGLDNVYRVLWLKKKKYDGIIHIKPSGCTPEIGAMPIIMRVAKKKKMPIIFLSFDEQTGIEGLNTRIEAFYDLLKIRKDEKKHESLFRN